MRCYRESDLRRVFNQSIYFTNPVVVRFYALKYFLDIYKQKIVNINFKSFTGMYLAHKSNNMEKFCCEPGFFVKRFFSPNDVT